MTPSLLNMLCVIFHSRWPSSTSLSNYFGCNMLEAMLLYTYIWTYIAWMNGLISLLFFFPGWLCFNGRPDVRFFFSACVVSNKMATILCHCENIKNFVTTFSGCNKIVLRKWQFVSFFLKGKSADSTININTYCLNAFLFIISHFSWAKKKQVKYCACC